MKTHFANLDRFKQLVKMLTIIFSLGQPMPVNHQGKQSDMVRIHLRKNVIYIKVSRNLNIPFIPFFFLVR